MKRCKTCGARCDKQMRYCKRCWAKVKDEKHAKRDRRVGFAIPAHDCPICGGRMETVGGESVCDTCDYRSSI